MLIDIVGAALEDTLAEALEDIPAETLEDPNETLTSGSEELEVKVLGLCDVDE